MKQSKQRVKTYISEANQNRIRETLSVEDRNEQSSQAEASKKSEDSSLQPQDTSPEIYEEPEALSAPITPLPPTSAAYDAEAVAGFTIGETYGDQGDYIENPDYSKETHTKDQE